MGIDVIMTRTICSKPKLPQKLFLHCPQCRVVHVARCPLTVRLAVVIFAGQVELGKLRAGLAGVRPASGFEHAFGDDVHAGFGPYISERQSTSWLMPFFALALRVAVPAVTPQL